MPTWIPWTPAFTADSLAFACWSLRTNAGMKIAAKSPPARITTAAMIRTIAHTGNGFLPPTGRPRSPGRLRSRPGLRGRLRLRPSPRLCGRLGRRRSTSLPVRIGPRPGAQLGRGPLQVSLLVVVDEGGGGDGPIALEDELVAVPGDRLADPRGGRAEGRDEHDSSHGFPALRVARHRPCGRWQEEWSGAPNGIRIRAAGLKGRCPRPLDDGGTRCRPGLYPGATGVAAGPACRPDHGADADVGRGRRSRDR